MIKIGFEYRKVMRENLRHIQRNAFNIQLSADGSRSLWHEWEY